MSKHEVSPTERAQRMHIASCEVMGSRVLSVVSVVATGATVGRAIYEMTGRKAFSVALGLGAATAVAAGLEAISLDNWAASFATAELVATDIKSAENV